MLERVLKTNGVKSQVLHGLPINTQIISVESTAC